MILFHKPWLGFIFERMVFKRPLCLYACTDHKSINPPERTETNGHNDYDQSSPLLTLIYDD